MNVLESSFSFLCEVGTMLSTPVESWDQVGNGVDICEVLVDERANSASSDDDVARMRVTIFLTLDRAGRVKAEVKEVVHKAGCRSHGMRHQRDSGYRVDTQRGERRPHT